jgi:hypothetical protein
MVSFNPYRQYDTTKPGDLVRGVSQTDVFGIMGRASEQGLDIGPSFNRNTKPEVERRLFKSA